MSPSPAAQLVVESFGVVATGTDHAEPAEFDHFVPLGRRFAVLLACGAAELDVGASPGHLSRHGDGILGTGLSDDLGFFGIVLGVEDHALHTGPAEEVGELFGLRDVVRTDQDRLPGFVDLLDELDDGFGLVGLRVVDPVDLVDTDVLGVGWDLGHGQVIELPELLTGRQRRTGHPAHLRVTPDQRLNGDGVDHLARIGLRQAFFQLDGCLQAIRPSLQLGDSPPRGVDEVDSPVAHDVVHVAFEQDVCVHRHVDVHERGTHMLFVVQVDATELLFDERRTLVGQVDVPALGVDFIVRLLQLADGIVDGFVGHFAGGRPGEDQRHQRFVDEHRVGLVDDRHVRFRRYEVFRSGGELVTQHVETDLVDRTVGDVGVVGGLALLARGVLRHRRRRDGELVEQRLHPLRVTSGEVVVHRDHVHPMSLQHIADRGDCTGQRLAFTGGHLDDVALEQPKCTLQLYVERPHVQRPISGFTDQRQETGPVLSFRVGDVELLRLGGEVLVAQLRRP